MAERTIVRDEPVMDQQGEAMRHAVERAERAEAELAKLKAKTPATTSGSETAPGDTTAAPGLFDGVDAADSKPVPAKPAPPAKAASGDHAAPAAHASEHLVEPGSMDKAKQPAAQSPEGHAAGEPQTTGLDALREDSMMAHLLDALNQGQDIGHYGRLTFAMIARHFLSDDEVLAELTRDEDFSEEDARQMLMQVEGRDYSPPRRNRIMDWQAEQEFAIIPNPHDPDCGNVYKTLRFPKETYDHIGHYQQDKASS